MNGVYKPPRKTCSQACSFCRRKKIKCNGGKPCPNCVDHGAQCVYPVAVPRKARTSALEVTALRERMSRMEALLPVALSQVAILQVAEPSLPCTGAPGTAPNATTQMPSGQDPRRASSMGDTPEEGLDVHLTPHDSVPDSFASPESVTLPQFSKPRGDPHLSRPPDVLEKEAHLLTRRSPTPPLTNRSIVSADDGSNAVPPEREYNFEYHGPGSQLSICSNSGVEWVIKKTGMPQFAQLAQKFTLDVCRRMKMDSRVSTRREPEPDEETAWLYAQIYFEEDLDSFCGVISQATFEAQLRAHFRRRRSTADEEDFEWYALRNAVYASGCRALGVTQGHSPQTEMCSKSWRYFENALSVHTDLLYSRTSLMAVQALILMSTYVEGIGYASLEYLLWSSALRLAESKGLHRQPAASWNLGQPAIEARSYLWWVIYAYERNNAFRGGRALAIPDANITCQFPTKAPDGSRVDYLCLLASLRLARLSGKITATITNLKHSNSGMREVFDTIADLRQELHSWLESLPEDFKVAVDCTSVNELTLTTTTPLQLVLYLRYGYHAAIIAVHSIVLHPWNSIPFEVKANEKEQFRFNIASGMDVVRHSSRKIILSLQKITLNVTTPKWLAFVFPLTALVNLFVYILRYPTLSTVESDISLLYLVAGHFSYLEFVVPGQTYPFVGELANIARQAVTRAKNEGKNRTQMPSSFKPAGLDYGPTMPSDDVAFGLPVGIDENTQELLDAMELNTEDFEPQIDWPGAPEIPWLDVTFQDFPGTEAPSPFV